MQSLRNVLFLIIALGFACLNANATTFTNPLNDTLGADPWLEYYNGNYYLASTTWTSKIYMKKSPTIEGLKTAPAVEIWDGNNDDPSRCCNMWAFEFRLLEGPNGPRWYFHYSAGVAENLDGQRMHVLESSGIDPLGPYTYKAQLQDGIGGWAIDGNYMQLNGNLYWLFSAWDGSYQKVYIAPMSNPWTISGNRVMLTQSEYSWEMQDGNVNEGPAALQRNGKTYITYSASHCNGPNYKLGLLTYVEGDPLQRSSWDKSAQPVFQRSDENGVYGPGHNGFFTSPDGTETWIVYHGQADPSLGCDEFRTTRIQRLSWSADDKPYFGIPLPTDAQIQVPSGEVGDTGFEGTRIEAYEFPNFYIRHTDYRAKVEGSISIFEDSQWHLRPGLADSSGVSFESVNFPGYYLRHADNEVSIVANDNTTLFREDATFYQRAGLYDSTEVSFESYNLPGHYLRHQDFFLNLTTASDDLSRRDATFRLYGEGASGSIVSGTTYQIKNRNSGKCLRTFNGSSANAASVVQYSCGNNGFEQWTVLSAGNDEYHIVQKSSGKYADIFAASTDPDASNIIWPDNGGANQRWRIEPQGSGYYHIVNVNSNLLLDISGASTADNANNIQWIDNGGSNQDWQFVPVN